MRMFHVNKEYENYNIYSMKKYVDKKRIIFTVIVGILCLFTICLILYYLINTSKQIKRTKQFVAQVEQYKQMQEEIKQQKENERKAKIPQLTEIGKENIKNIYNQETKKAFLTFDDGPSINTKDILDILKQNEITTTFFVLGSQVKVFPETTNRIYNEGHYIANHGYSHIYSNIYQSPEQVLNEYIQCNQIVANTINVPEYNSHLFRFPGGSVGGKYTQIKNDSITLLEENNIMYINWNALTGDSEKVDPTEEYLMDNLQKTTQGKNSIVVLMHDSQAKRETVQCLPKVIEFLRNEGYEFENFYSIIK